MNKASWNRVELFGCVVRKTERRTAPDGSSLLRMWVSCGEGKDVFEMEVLVLGEKGRELSYKVEDSGNRLNIIGRLRPIRRASRLGLAETKLCVVADEICPTGDNVGGQRHNDVASGDGSAQNQG